MPFREKTAWITLIALIPPLLFFGGTGLGLIHHHGWATVHLFLLSVIAFVVLRVALHVIAALMSPRDAKAPLDERERLISLRATRNANLVLIIGILCVPLQLHLAGDAPQMGYIAMMALIVSETVRAASRIVYYRMDS